jgi:hypothetical protein
MYYNNCFRLNAYLNFIRGTRFEICSLKISNFAEHVDPLSYEVQTTNKELGPLPARIRLELVNQKELALDALLSLSLDVPFLESLHLDNCQFTYSENTFIRMSYTSIDSISLTNYDQQEIAWEGDSGNSVRRFSKANQLITIILQGEEHHSSTSHYICYKDDNDLIKLDASRDEFCGMTETCLNDYTLVILRVKSLKKLLLCTRLGRTCSMEFST